MEQRQDDTRPYRRKDLGDDADLSRPIPSQEGEIDTAEPRRLELLEERLVARKREEQIGEVVIRKEVDEVPSRLDVETHHDEVAVEHIPVGRVVNEREEPRREGEDLVMPVYEEQIVMVKRLVLREYVRVRRTRATEHQVYADTVRRDRLVVEDPDGTGRVHEFHRGPNGEDLADGNRPAGGGLTDWLRRMFS